jgi:hypothetical protein
MWDYHLGPPQVAERLRRLRHVPRVRRLRNALCVKLDTHIGACEINLRLKGDKGDMGEGNVYILYVQLKSLPDAPAARAWWPA